MRTLVFKLMRPLYPGAMPSVRLNLFNVVFILDLSRIQALNLLVGPMSTIINRGIPIRFGLVPSTESEDGKFSSSTSDVWYAETNLQARKWHG
jgi:UDP-glucose:glycoprotein glucosyltransferase